MNLFRNFLPHASLRQPKSLHLVPPPGKKRVERGATNPANLPEVTSVVREMYTLLQDYSPSWYSEYHHTRIQQALHQLEVLQNSDHVPTTH